MTEEEWNNIEIRLYDSREIVNLQVDEYELTLIVQREKNKLNLFVYVNGQFKFEWLNEDCDIRKRFYCQSTHCLISNKEICKITKNKKSQQRIKEHNSFVSYSPYWNSFNKFKRHLIANNQNICLSPK